MRCVGMKDAHAVDDFKGSAYVERLSRPHVAFCRQYVERWRDGRHAEVLAAYAQTLPGMPLRLARGALNKWWPSTKRDED